MEQSAPNKQRQGASKAGATNKKRDGSKASRKPRARKPAKKPAKRAPHTPSTPSTLFCVLDFEATCCDKNKRWKNEVIEFPSVLYRFDHATQELTHVDTVQRFCKPQYVNGEGGQLTEFCRQLTGITQDQVDGGQPFPQVLKDHQAWLEAHRLTFPAAAKSVSQELQQDHHHVPTSAVATSEPLPTKSKPDAALLSSIPEEVVFVTCGNWDLKTMMPLECSHWGLKVPLVYKQFVNIKLFVGGLLSVRVRGMPHLLKLTGLELQGRHHSGLDDSLNIGRALEKVAEWGKLNRYSEYLHSLEEH